jgi:[ribosomal protein S5]-alanine N-acetyltransferase
VGADDLAVVHTLHSDPRTNLHNPYGASASLDETRTMLEGWVRHRDDFGFGYELIGAGDDAGAGAGAGGTVGICGVRRDVWHGLHVLNLYWRLLPEVWGRGYATAAGLHALEVAQQVRHRELIVARIVEGNAASARIAEKLGMQRRPDLDGALDGADWVIFAV